MAEFSLMLLDATDIQSYIFGSNQLAQNIGASELVERATSQWLVKTLDQLKISHNSAWSIEKGIEYLDGVVGEKDAEIVYAGGGSAVILFKEDALAEEFVQTLTHRVIYEARGLTIVAARRRFLWAEDGSSQAIAQILADLRKVIFERKLNHVPSTPLPGLAVTAACTYTGMPAVGYNTDPKLVGDEIADRMVRLNEKQLISKEVADKLRAEPMGKDRLHAILPQVRQNNYGFIYDFDEFGDKGESSYIAVVHTDGNGMGKRFDNIANEYRNPSRNREYINALRALSLSIRDKAQKALNDTVDYLIDGISHSIEFQTRVRGETSLLPFRPIVFGGDDVTFVCDGRLGIDLASRYLNSFTKEKLSDEKPIHARAGIAVVKTHFPFSRAYDLAEDLARSAKRAIPARKSAEEESTTLIDWHFSTTGVIRTLDEIRHKEYRTRNGQSLLMRPIRLSPVPGEVWQNWDNFQKLIGAFRKDEWAGKRNKIKDLMGALRSGPEQVTLFCKNYRIRQSDMPSIDGKVKFQECGWDKGDCGYFDAIEALDFMVDLHPQTAQGEEVGL